jgi:YVTN family beta-propeller protein
VFQNVNGFGLGDVLQDISEANGKLYITMNNSGKIVILDTVDFAFLGEINGLTSPRYFKALNNSTGYVSDLYSNSIQVIDLTTNSISGNISTQRWTEHLLIHNDYLYAEAPDTSWVFVINTNTNLIEDTIEVGRSPNGLVLDKNENIWVLSTGGSNQELASLKCINPLNRQIIKTILFNNLSESPSQLRIDAAGEQLYFLNEGLQTIPINSSSIPLVKNITPNGSIFYGMNVDQNTKEIYITDAVDYVQQGKVYRYDSIFQPIDTFVVGIIPQSIWFK